VKDRISFLIPPCFGFDRDTDKMVVMRLRFTYKYTHKYTYNMPYTMYHII